MLGSCQMMDMCLFCIYLTIITKGWYISNLINTNQVIAELIRKWSMKKVGYSNNVASGKDKTTNLFSMLHDLLHHTKLLCILHTFSQLQSECFRFEWLKNAKVSPPTYKIFDFSYCIIYHLKILVGHDFCPVFSFIVIKTEEI